MWLVWMRRQMQTKDSTNTHQSSGEDPWMTTFTWLTKVADDLSTFDMGLLKS